MLSSLRFIINFILIRATEDPQIDIPPAPIQYFDYFNLSVKETFFKMTSHWMPDSFWKIK